jgi:hypothetical protein
MVIQIKAHGSETPSDRREFMRAGLAGLSAALFGGGCASVRQGQPDTASRLQLGRGADAPQRQPTAEEVIQQRVKIGVFVNQQGSGQIFDRSLQTLESSGNGQGFSVQVNAGRGAPFTVDIVAMGQWSRSVEQRLRDYRQTSVVVDLDGTVHPIYAGQRLLVENLPPCPREYKK